MSPALVVRGVTHRYAGSLTPAVDDVTFEVGAGTRVGLLGQNGAGKSTLMRLCCGFLPLRIGTIEVAGRSVHEGAAARGAVGYQPENVPLYPELRVREHLAFRAALKGLRKVSSEVLRVAEETGLGRHLQVPIGALSRGYRQRVGIADALLGAPPLLVLDEPTVSLDPTQVQEVRTLLREVTTEATLVFSSHILSEVEALCERVVVLHHGRVVADEAVADGGGTIVCALDADRARAALVCQGAGLAPESLTDDGAGVVVTLPTGDPAQAMRALGEAARAQNVAVHRLEHRRGDLQARFAELTVAAPARTREGS